MLAHVTHILPLTNIRRMRTLPVAGSVLVRPGQKVNASDVVAQAQVPSGHVILDIRRGLGIPQVSAAESCIVRQVGDRLEKGDVIAESGGVFARIIRAPQDGEIVSIGGGQVLMRVRTTSVEVTAGFAGTVADILKDQGAIIETSGALIQGVWGNGRADNGLLVLVLKNPDDELTRAQIEVGQRGAVVVGGHCASAEVLHAGAELPLRGLVLTSMASDLIREAEAMNYPIIVLEGFGKIPLNQAAFQLLSTSDQRDASVNAAFHRMTGERPELIIPLPALGQAAQETDYFTAGQTVRIQGAPYAGRFATILQARTGLFTLPSGLKAAAADVQLDDGTKVTVPLANLEVIE
jgi:hypothetical protein